MRKMIISLCLLTLVAVVAGCGGGGSGDQLSAGDLKKQANAICTDLNKKTQAAAKTQDFDTALKATNDALDKLKALNPPDELKDKYQAFVDGASNEVPTLTKLVKAVNDKDIPTAQKLSSQVDAANGKVNAAATAAGLDACAAN
jgi:hypothetical protein